MGVERNGDEQCGRTLTDDTVSKMIDLVSYLSTSLLLIPIS